MDWSTVVSTISQAAPILGSLFGPAGTAVGALAGTGIKLVAAALGVQPTKEAITAAISTDPEATLKLAQYQMANQLELQKLMITAETSNIAVVNATMQAESKSEKWPQYSWRPFWGFTSGTAFLVVCILVCILGYQAVANKDAAALGNIPLVIGAFATLFAIPGAILGIASYKRGDMQIAEKNCSQ